MSFPTISKYYLETQINKKHNSVSSKTGNSREEASEMTFKKETLIERVNRIGLEGIYEFFKAAHANTAKTLSSSISAKAETSTITGSAKEELKTDRHSSSEDSVTLDMSENFEDES